jgi:hypothetical protein
VIVEVLSAAPSGGQVFLEIPNQKSRQILGRGETLPRAPHFVRTLQGSRKRWGDAKSEKSEAVSRPVAWLVAASSCSL